MAVAWDVFLNGNHGVEWVGMDGVGEPPAVARGGRWEVAVGSYVPARLPLILISWIVALSCNRVGVPVLDVLEAGLHGPQWGRLRCSGEWYRLSVGRVRPGRGGSDFAANYPTCGGPARTGLSGRAHTGGCVATLGFRAARQRSSAPRISEQVRLQGPTRILPQASPDCSPMWRAQSVPRGF